MEYSALWESGIFVPLQANDNTGCLLVMYSVIVKENVTFNVGRRLPLWIKKLNFLFLEIWKENNSVRNNLLQ